MSKSINQVLLIGNVGNSPEIRMFENGVKVATFSLATSIGGYEKKDGTKVEIKTSWHNIVAWRGLADISEKFVHKGDKLTVIGSISYREYEKDGVKKFITDILASDLVLMGKSDASTKPPITANDIPSNDFHPVQDDLPF